MPKLTLEADLHNLCNRKLDTLRCDLRLSRRQRRKVAAVLQARGYQPSDPGNRPLQEWPLVRAQ